MVYLPEASVTLAKVFFPSSEMNVTPASATGVPSRETTPETGLSFEPPHPVTRSSGATTATNNETRRNMSGGAPERKGGRRSPAGVAATPAATEESVHRDGVAV